MSVADPLQLSQGIAFIPIQDLPEDVQERLRDQFGACTGHAITQTRGRRSSILVSEDTAQLLQEFATASTIVDAVIRFSCQRDLDPERVLEASFPTLRRCLDDGYLVESKAQHPLALKHAYAVGDRVGGGVVIRSLHTLEDSEIYQVALDAGGLAALKVLRTSRSTSAAETFQREAAVLEHLGGRIAPQLLGVGVEAGNPWLMLEWCDGVPVAMAANVLRVSPGRDRELLSLCRRITQAYAQIHAEGVVHGDAHPGNLILAPDGRVRLVDFGLACWADLPPTCPEAPRGGVPAYIAPDQADAMLSGAAPGPATESSELYCLASVLYEILTGHGYLEFALDEREMLRQIVEDAPLPFTRVGRPSWPEVEGPLRAALAKDPTGRPASIAELDQMLAAAEPSGAAARSAASGASAPSRTILALDRLLENVLSYARPGGQWFTGGVPTAPLVSIAYGSGGLALALHHVATIVDDPGLAALADEWAARATADATGREAFEDPRYELTEAVTGRVTPFHRRSGLHAVQALISHSLDNAQARQEALDGYVTESRQPCPNIDLVLGRTGTLLGASILYEAIAGARQTDMTGLVELGNDTLRGIWAELDRLPPIAEGTQQRCLGIAHGWAGFLLATMRWCRAAGVARPHALEERLIELAEMAIPTGAGARWPWTNEGTTSVPGWCNGSAGYVHLWTTAHTTFQDDRWADLAERAAWDAYVTPALAQLCCGLAGQAYALLTQYRHAGERRWLTAATELAVRAASDVLAGNAEGCVSGSLHKGEPGIAVLAADLNSPETAMMPFFGSL